MQLEAGAVLEGRVTGITAFGAFVALPDGKSGLVHISEVANTYVNDIHEHLSVGQTVKVKVLSISPEGKISLSIKRAADTPAPAPRPAQPRRPAETAAPAADGAQVYVPTKSGDQNFEDKLKRFMQVSDSKISGNRLYENQKKSRGRRK
jgi:S1 RNA binding domain protein